MHDDDGEVLVCICLWKKGVINAPERVEFYVVYGMITAAVVSSMFCIGRDEQKKRYLGKPFDCLKCVR